MTIRSVHRSNHISKRYRAATVIQCAFRCYLTKNFIYRRRYEYQVTKMNQAAIKIQLLVRRILAKDIVERKRERSTMERRALGVLKIQSQVRMMLSRRRVAARKFKLYWLAARMIQGCFRGRNTRKCMAVYLAAQEKVKFFRGARGFQQIIRGRIGRSRVNRIKLRYLYLKIFKAVTKIQSMARKFSAINRVKKCKDDKKFQDNLRRDVILAAEKSKDAKEAEDLVKSMDIFYQTRCGETSTVDALYHSELESGVSAEDIINVKNDLGDTILSQASKFNHLDIIRKCINWGYDVNHENELGENVITLAASEGHMSIVTYLLSDSQRNAAEIMASMPKKEKKVRKVKKKKPKDQQPKPEPDTDPSPVVEGDEEKKSEEQSKEENGGGEDMTFMTGQYDESEKKDDTQDTDVKESTQKDDNDNPTEESKQDSEKAQENEVDDDEEEEEEEVEEEEAEPVIQSTKVLNLSSEDMGTILVAAAKHPDLTHLKMIIDNKFVSNVNEVQPLTDLTALHVACEEGHSEHVEFLLKSGASLDCKDDNGQLPLHKAAKSSLDLFKKLLSLTNVGNSADTAKNKEDLLLLKDTDGKDCFIIASLHGQTDIVEYITENVDMSTRVISDEVGWSMNDIINTSLLVENGNLTCLKNVVLEGYDSSWCPEETGMTIAMMACKHGRTDIIDYLLTDVGADFAACDESGMNSLHFAAQFTRKDLIPLLLSAGEKAKESCNLAKSLLTVQDKKGYTPVHYIAQFGSTLSFELLAQSELVSSLSLSDVDGCTPLLIACKYKQSKKISELLKLGADAKAVDNKGNNTLWHYFIEITSGPDFAFKVNPTVEIEIVQSLLQNGCPLFNGNKAAVERDIEHIVSEYVGLFGTNKKKQHPVNQHEATFDYLVTNIQPTDIAAIENNLSFFNMLPSLISPVECWGAALSTIFFYPAILDVSDSPYDDKGSKKCLASLFEGKAGDVLIKLNENGDEKVAVETKAETDKETTDNKTDTDDLADNLQSILFKEVSILGWCIKAKNEATVEFFLRKGLSPNASVDDNGNKCLHWAVMYGTAPLVYALFDATNIAMPNVVILLEAVNNKGQTASMLGAKLGKFECTKAVIEIGASARTALGGKYWAWLLAMTMQYESREINSQTGIYGDDDELYFPLQPQHQMPSD